MSIFDILAESKIKDWLHKKDSPKYVAQPRAESTPKDKSFEGHLLEEVKRLLLEASQTISESEKKRLLTESNNLKFQLLISYERKRLYLYAQSVQEQLAEYKRKIFI